MIEFNLLILTISSLLPITIGAIWYNPKLFGKKDSQKHKPIIYIVTFVLSFAYSIALSYQVIHQLHFQSMFYNELGFFDGEGTPFKDFIYILETYGQNFRSFQHGAFHGFLNSIFIVLPILCIHWVFEGKTWKYILTHWGYWAVCGTLMGGVICEFY